MNETLLLELGGVLLGLALLARAAGSFGIPAIPLYLLAGLAFGEGGLLPLVNTERFVEAGAEIGLILLLFMLGLEYSAAELVGTLRRSSRAAAVDVVLNYTPGFAAGLILGWGLVPSMFLGGATLVTSSGIAARVLEDLGRIRSPVATMVVSMSILEDLAMALYLPILAALLVGGASLAGLGTAVLAVAGVAAVLALSLRFEVGLSRLIFSRSDEALLLSILGFTLLMAGLAELGQVSGAVGALVAGIVLSGHAAEGARALLSPVRDLFAAVFFAFIGLSVDPASIPPVLFAAISIGVVSAATKFATGWLAGGWSGMDRGERALTGAALIARGEFSIAIAGLALTSTLEPRLAPLILAYVLVLAVVGPVSARIVDAIDQRHRAQAAPQ